MHTTRHLARAIILLMPILSACGDEGTPKDEGPVDLSCQGQKCIRDADCRCNAVNAVCGPSWTCVITGCDPQGAGAFECPSGSKCVRDAPRQVNVCDDGFYFGTDSQLATDTNDTTDSGSESGSDSNDATVRETDTLTGSETGLDSGSQTELSTDPDFSCIGDTSLTSEVDCQNVCRNVQVSYAPWFGGCIIVNCDMDDPSTCPAQQVCQDAAAMGGGYDTFCNPNAT